MLQVIDHSVYLIHHPLFILMLHTHLVPIRFTDRAVLVCPCIPDVAVKVMDVIGFLLPDPEHFVGGALERRLSERHDRKLFGQIITVHNPKNFHRISAFTVRPVRSYLLPFRAGPILQNVPAHVNKNLICHTHVRSPVSFCILMITYPTYHTMN